MSDSTLHTAQLHAWLDQMRSGDQAARDELLRSVCTQLERLAHSMLTKFPSVARWEEPEDVLQNAVLRLLRALESVRPDSVRGFYALAATQMRRELIDLARHYRGPQGLGANHASHVVNRDSAASAETRRCDPADAHESGEDLDRWAAFHEAVENLPCEEREVLGLIFYHGWTQTEVAALLQASERTIRRRWQSACAKLQSTVGDELLSR